MIPKDITQKIIDAADLIQVLEAKLSLKKKGSQLVCDCPKCGEKDKFNVSKAKSLGKCFVCGFAVKSAQSYLMEIENMTYPDALRWLADFYKIAIEDGKPQVHAARQAKREAEGKAVQVNKGSSFRDLQLRASGIPDKAQQSFIIRDEDTNTRVEVDLYQSATVDEKWTIVPGNDIVMHYLDLEHRPMTYYKRDKKGAAMGSPLPLIRVRWEHPELHTDKHGDSMKYQSPAGSGSNIWIPELIRTKFKQRAPIDTLYIQEGEKKADAATLNGMLSIGIMGIHNLASNKQLPADLLRILKDCRVQNVVFMLDSDFADISNNLKKPINLRPWTFFSAVRNYRDWMYSLHNSDITLNIYFGHVKQNDLKDKGVDDLLANTLKDKPEQTLKADAEFAMTSVKGEGAYLNIYRITTMAEQRLKEFWCLHDDKELCNKHKKLLQPLQEFSIGQNAWRWNSETQEFEIAQALMADEKFWFTEQNERTGKENYKFVFYNFRNFMRNRGFAHVIMPDGNPQIVHVEKGIIRDANLFQLKKYVNGFLDTDPKKYRPISEMVLSTPKYLSAETFSHLPEISPTVMRNEIGKQHMFFEEFYWTITSKTIEQSAIAEMGGQVWHNSLISAKPSRIIDNMLRVSKDEDGNYMVHRSEELNKCHLDQMMRVTSCFASAKLRQNFYATQKNKANGTDLPMPYTFDSDEKWEWERHYLSKLSAIGYMCHRYFDSAVAKSVIAMDGKIGDIGDANGRSGKSLLGRALTYSMNTVTVNGKTFDPARFPFERVDGRTALVFIDDVQKHFDFEAIFPHITGGFEIEKKGVGKYVIPMEDTPKILITTNYAMNGTTGSFKDRQFVIAFSDFFNEDFKPTEFFGCRLFDDWDGEQWTYYYNFIAHCVQIYFQHGIIEAPQDNIKMRKLQQQMGADFMEWAEGFFVNDVEKGIKRRNHWVMKIEAHEDFFKMFPNQRKFTNSQAFKKKIKAYCEFNGLVFNPNTPIKATPDNDGAPHGGDNKTGGKEWIMIADNYDATDEQPEEPRKAEKNPNVAGDDDLPF